MGAVAKPDQGDAPMGKTLTVRITESAGEIHDLRYRFIWSARMGGRLLGEGHAFDPEEAIAQVQDLIGPDHIQHILIDYRAKGCSGRSR